MRRILSGFVLALCCIALASGLGAQTSQTQSAPEQTSENENNTTSDTGGDGASDSANSLPEVTLKARPFSCATLRQGQPCYVRFSMSWESSQPITACLVSENSDVGTCWQNKMSGEFRKTMYLTETTRWDLQTLQGLSLGQVQVRVAWVYRSSRVRRNWRLF